MNKLNYIIICVLIVLTLPLILAQGAAPSSVTILGGAQLYNETCILGTDCVSGLCFENTTLVCGCISNSDCSVGTCDLGTNLCGTTANIDAEFDIYSPNVTVELNGSGWTPNATINITFGNATNITSFLTIVDSNGTLNTTFFLVNNTEYDNYTFYANEINSSLSDTDQIEVLAPYEESGFIFTELLVTAEPSNVTLFSQTGQILAVDDEFYNFTFQYGQKYDVEVVPNNLSCAVKFRFKKVRAQGVVGNFLGLDAIETNLSNYLEWECLFSYNPVLPYKSVDITALHNINPNLEIYKCTNFSFTNRSCLDDTSTGWALLGSVSTLNQTTFNVLAGDPIIGIAAPNAPVIEYVLDTPDPVTYNNILNVYANVSDNVQVDEVTLEVDYGNGTKINFTMVLINGTTANGTYYNDSIKTTLSNGVYNYTIYARDNSNKEALPVSGTFTVVGAPVTLPPGGGGGGSGPHGQPQCSDGYDNDADGLTDYPNDPGCLSATDNNEVNLGCTPQWSCTQWNQCVDGTQLRTCVDLNKCSNDATKPDTLNICGEVPSVEFEDDTPLKKAALYVTKSIDELKRTNPVWLALFLIALSWILIFLLDQTVIVFKQKAGDIVALGIRNRPMFFRRSITDIILVDDTDDIGAVVYKGEEVKFYSKGTITEFLKHYLSDVNSFSMNVGGKTLTALKECSRPITLRPGEEIHAEYNCNIDSNYYAEYHTGTSRAPAHLEKELAILEQIDVKLPLNPILALEELESSLNQYSDSHAKDVINRIHQLKLIFK